MFMGKKRELDTMGLDSRYGEFPSSDGTHQVFSFTRIKKLIRYDPIGPIFSPSPHCHIVKVLLFFFFGKIYKGDEKTEGAWAKVARSTS